MPRTLGICRSKALFSTTRTPNAHVFWRRFTSAWRPVTTNSCHSSARVRLLPDATCQARRQDHRSTPDRTFGVDANPQAERGWICDRASRQSPSHGALPKSDGQRWCAQSAAGSGPPPPAPRHCQATAVPLVQSSSRSTRLRWLSNADAPFDTRGCTEILGPSLQRRCLLGFWDLQQGLA